MDSKIYEIENMLQNHLNLFDELYHNGAFQSALIKLAEMNNFLSVYNGSNKIKYKWIDLVEKKFTNSNFRIEDIVLAVNSDLKKIEKVISIGSEFNDDEFLLILTLKVQVELIADFFNNIGLNDMLPEFDNLDREIIEVSNQKQNKIEFNKAANQMQKNWGFPIINKWFGNS